MLGQSIFTYCMHYSSENLDLKIFYPKFKVQKHLLVQFNLPSDIFRSHLESIRYGEHSLVSVAWYFSIGLGPSY